MSQKHLNSALRIAKERRGYAGGMSVWDPSTWFNSNDPSMPPEGQDILKEVQAERSGTPLEGSVAYENQQKAKSQFLPSPSPVDEIRPSESRGPADYAYGAASWLANKVQDPNATASDKAAGQRRMEQIIQFFPEIFGVQSAYNAGAEGAKGNYGAAALEGAYAASGALPFMSPGIKAVGEAADLARAAMTAPRASAEGAVVSGPSRRSFLQGMGATALASQVPVLPEAIMKAVPEATSTVLGPAGQHAALVDQLRSVYLAHESAAEKYFNHSDSFGLSHPETNAARTEWNALGNKISETSGKINEISSATGLPSSSHVLSDIADEHLAGVSKDVYQGSSKLPPSNRSRVEANVEAPKEAPQIEAPKEVSKEAPQIEAPKEEPKLSLTDQRQAAQDRIKELRSQLNTLQEGTPEHGAIKTQIAEEGAKLGQLRGPAQEAVVKEAPPVDIKSRSPTGLYSEAEEIARRLPQADTPENLVKAILNKGVKDAELIDARVMNKDRTPTPQFTEYLASRGSQQPIPDAVGDYIADNSPSLLKRTLRGSETKYHDYPDKKEHPEGESNYRELLFHNPPDHLGLQYDGGHWSDVQPGTAMHARVSDTPDSLFVHEIQSDQAQQGRLHGFSDLESYRKANEDLKIAKSNWDKTQQEKNELQHLMLDAPLEQVSDIKSKLDAASRAELTARIEFMRVTQEAAQATSSSGYGIYESPHVQDTGAWTRAMIKELLSEAEQSGKSKIKISGGNVQNVRANGPDEELWADDFTDHTHYYNNVIPSEFKSVLKSLDPEANVDQVVRLRKSYPTIAELNNDPHHKLIQENIKNNIEYIKNVENAEHLDSDDVLEEIEGLKEQLNYYYAALDQIRAPRDRIEVNLTPRMIEAIKTRKLTKYFQGGRVE